MNLKFNCGMGTLIEILYGILRSRSSYFMGTYIGGVQILYSYKTIDKPVIICKLLYYTHRTTHQLKKKANLKMYKVHMCQCGDMQNMSKYYLNF